MRKACWRGTNYSVFCASGAVRVARTRQQVRAAHKATLVTQTSGCRGNPSGRRHPGTRTSRACPHQLEPQGCAPRARICRPCLVFSRVGNGRACGQGEANRAATSHVRAELRRDSARRSRGAQSPSSLLCAPPRGRPATTDARHVSTSCSLDDIACHLRAKRSGGWPPFLQGATACSHGAPGAAASSFAVRTHASACAWGRVHHPAQSGNAAQAPAHQCTAPSKSNTAASHVL
jgi:hypothetical protein